MTSQSNKPIIQEIDGVQYEFVYNSKGTLIKKCCASCKFKQPFDQEGPRRSCNYNKAEKEKKIVDKRDCCQEWGISEDIDKVKTATSIRPDEKVKKGN